MNTDLLDDAFRHPEPASKKIAQMAEVYLKRHAVPNEQAKLIVDAVSAVQWKFMVSSVHLEELWRMSERARLTLPELIENAVTLHRWDERDRFDATRHLESFLFQARSFIDVFMRLGCEALSSSPPVYMSVDDFRRSLCEAPAANHDRAERLQQYFDREVFGLSSWGTLVRSLRDKIAHRDSLRPSQAGQEHVAGIRLDWPTIKGVTFERLAQGFHNGAFELVRSASPIVFDSAWYSGPYRANAYDAG